jgi:hypothetical protein
MRKILFVTTVVVILGALAILLGACELPSNSNSSTDVTFTIEAFHQKTGGSVTPLIDATVFIDGFMPWDAGVRVPAPYKFTVSSRDYPPAEFEVKVVAQIVEPNPDVVLKCTWGAQTPAGIRLSRDSSGGEGESYAGAPVDCKYFA